MTFMAILTIFYELLYINKKFKILKDKKYAYEY